MDLSHGIWPRPRHGLRMVGSAHGIWTEPHLAREPDELPIPEELVALVSSNAVSSRSQDADDVPVRVPHLGYRVLYHDPVTELEWSARELGTIFLDFVSVLEPQLQVVGYLRVRDALVMLGGRWGSCSLSSSE